MHDFNFVWISALATSLINQISLNQKSGSPTLPSVQGDLRPDACLGCCLCFCLRLISPFPTLHGGRIQTGVRIMCSLELLFHVREYSETWAKDLELFHLLANTQCFCVDNVRRGVWGCSWVGIAPILARPRVEQLYTSRRSRITPSNSSCSVRIICDWTLKGRSTKGLWPGTLWVTWRCVF